MFGGLHWYDLIILVVPIGVLAMLGASIGAGYAWMRHRLERRPEHP